MLHPWKAAEYLRTPEDVAMYLNVVLEDGDPAPLKAALLDVAEAQSMPRASGGDPKAVAANIGDMLDLMRRLGLRFTATADHPAGDHPAA